QVWLVTSLWYFTWPTARVCPGIILAGVEHHCRAACSIRVGIKHVDGAGIGSPEHEAILECLDSHRDDLGGCKWAKLIIGVSPEEKTIIRAADIHCGMRQDTLACPPDRSRS